MNLGYCVVFSHMEQGWEGLSVVVTESRLNKAISMVESLSGYPRDHERYKQEVFDLTEMYHKHGLGMITDKDLAHLRQYSPESVEVILAATPVDYSVQVHRPLDTRTWINRKWDFVTTKLNEHLEESAKAYRESYKRDV